MSEAAIITPPETGQRKLKGWHVLLIFFAFFGVMFAVNGVFLYHAITSFPGEDVKKSYVQGLNYNQTLEARAAQSVMGWKAEAGLVEGELVFRLQDQDGQPLSGYPVIAELRRLTTDTEDQVLTLLPSLRGEYRADAGTLVSGSWRVQIQVLDQNADTVIFTANKQVIVK